MRELNEGIKGKKWASAWLAMEICWHKPRVKLLSLPTVSLHFSPFFLQDCSLKSTAATDKDMQSVREVLVWGNLYCNHFVVICRFWDVLEVKKKKLIFFPLFRHLGILELARLVDIQFAPIKYKKISSNLPTGEGGTSSFLAVCRTKGKKWLIICLLTSRVSLAKLKLCAFSKTWQKSR